MLECLLGTELDLLIGVFEMKPRRACDTCASSRRPARRYVSQTRAGSDIPAEDTCAEDVREVPLGAEAFGM